MNDEEMKQRDQEWIKVVRIAHLKRLSLTEETLNSNDKIILKRLKSLLLENGTTEETINQEILAYRDLSEEGRNRELIEKAEELTSLITEYLEIFEEISSKDYPELYHRIQELVALNPDIANTLIKDTFTREHINHCMSCGDSLYGRTCTYYFSKKLSYE